MSLSPTRILERKKSPKTQTNRPHGLFAPPSMRRMKLATWYCRVLLFVCLAGMTAGVSVAARTTPKQRQPEQVELQILGESRVYSIPVPVLSAPPDALALYQRVRHGPDFRYVIKNLPEGRPLTINFGFAEPSETLSRPRLFTVELNGAPVLKELDVAREAGGVRKALLKTVKVISPRQLEIRFHGIQGDAFVNFVRIEGLGQEIVIGPGASQLLAPPEPAPCDPASGVIRAREGYRVPHCGMPLGGVGTGTFEIFPDGMFGNFTINNSWPQAVPLVPGTFIAVRAKYQSHKGDARILRIGGNHPGYQNAKLMKECTYRATFPIVEMDFADAEFPLDVRVQAFSPIVPYDLFSSSLPVVFVVVEVVNPNKFPVSSAVAMSWEDLTGRGSGGNPEDTFDVSPTLAHNDAGSGLLRGIHLTSVEPPVGRRATFLGDSFIGTTATGTVVTRLLHWDPTSPTIPWWQDFIQSGRIAKTPPNPSAWGTAQAKNGQSAVVICSAFNLAPRETRRIPFLISWFCPRIVEEKTGTIFYHAYVDHFSSSVGVAIYAAERFAQFEKATTKWRDEILQSDLPWWFSHVLMLAAERSVASSVLLRDDSLFLLESVNGGRWAPLCPALVSPASAWLRSFYPELDASILLALEQLYSPDPSEGKTSARTPRIMDAEYTRPSEETLTALATHSLSQWIQTREPSVVKESWKLLRQNLERPLEWERGDEIISSHTTCGVLSGIVSEKMAPYRFIHRAATLRAAAKIAHIVEQDRVSSSYESDLNAIRRKAELSYSRLLEEESSSRENLSRGLCFALAGDWQLRYLTGEDILTEKLRQCLHEVCGKTLSTRSESQQEGLSERDLLPEEYLFSTWLGAEAIYSGFPNSGFEIVREKSEELAQRRGNLWAGCLGLENCAVKPWASPLSALAGSMWSVLDALHGTHYSYAEETLFVLPHLPYDMGEHVVMPVYTPSFHGLLDYDAIHHEWELSIERMPEKHLPTNPPVRKIVCIDSLAQHETKVYSFEGEPLVLQPQLTISVREGMCTATKRAKPIDEMLFNGTGKAR